MIPLSLRIATLLPDEAMRVSRVAEPLSDVAKLEKVSLCNKCEITAFSRGSAWNNSCVKEGYGGERRDTGGRE
jgi:hypothetical protein